jgi:hypothetical protein
MWNVNENSKIEIKSLLNKYLFNQKSKFKFNINKIKIYIFLTFLFISIFLHKNFNSLFVKINKPKIIYNIYNNNIKVCLCTPCKNENRYIREFVEYYKNYGIDKIFLYDNNDKNGEKLEEVIGDYVNDRLVEILNWRGEIRPVFRIMNDCYQKNYKTYNWLVFFEVDEYIHLRNYSNIKEYLNLDSFKNCQKIHLNWVHHTDNNLIHYDNRTLHERFPEVEPNAINNVRGSVNSVKTILRGHIPNITIDSIHTLNMTLRGCDGFGRYQFIPTINTHNSDFRYYYIDHYYSKSLEEFIEKLNKGDVAQGQALWLKMLRINNYFSRNNITLEKLDYIEKNAHLNLSHYKDELKKNEINKK